jgi:hypothetical protein
MWNTSGCAAAARGSWRCVWGKMEQLLLFRSQTVPTAVARISPSYPDTKTSSSEASLLPGRRSVGTKPNQESQQRCSYDGKWVRGGLGLGYSLPLTLPREKVLAPGPISYACGPLSRAAAGCAAIRGVTCQTQLAAWPPQGWLATLCLPLFCLRRSFVYPGEKEPRHQSPTAADRPVSINFAN